MNKKIIGFDAKRANANRTGLGNYSRFIIGALAHSPYKAQWRMYIPKRKENAEYDALLACEDVSSQMPQKKIWRCFSSLWRSWAMIEDLRRDGIRLFHGLSNELPIGIERSGIKSVVTIHDLIFLRYPRFYNPIDRRIYKWKFARACRCADKIVAVSECTKRDIVERFHIAPDKIEVIYQGCNEIFSEPVPEEQRHRIVRKYDLPTRYILTVGTLEPRKNLQAIVEALAYLPVDVHVVAVGRSTQYSENVLRQACNAGLASRIHLFHRVPLGDLPAIYKQAEVMVYPSFFEGFGIPVVEALTVGVPVVAATGSCLEEAGGPDSLYVSPDNSHSLAEAICRILNDKKMAAAMVLSGKEYVKIFSKEAIAAKLTALYDKLL